MKFIGNGVKITGTYIDLITESKKQEIDTFFTEIKSVVIKGLFQVCMITAFEVNVQSIK